MQRDESYDGQHSLGSCCPEDLSVRCRLLRESDPRTRGPRSKGRRPGAPKWVPGWCGGRGGGRRRRAVLGQGCGCLGVARGNRALLGQAADVPVAVPPLVFKVFSQDGFSSVLLRRPSSRTGTRC